MPLTIALADDCALLRAGIAQLLRAEGFDVVGQARDPEALLRVVATCDPDVAIIDIRMPPTHTTEGLEVASEIRLRYPRTAVLLLSQHVESEYARELLATDATGIGYLLKDRISHIDEFLDAVRRVAAGGTAIDPTLITRMLARPAASGATVESLSPREHQVLSAMAEGRSNRGIATALRLTERTIETHVSSIFAKLALPPEPDDHRRVLAVLHHLKALT
ncbi:response regulator transcription factor [Nocardia sp. CDC160]|uniref:response regulator transcription factor n=1 Tax=Nocardia sp. CDC160 TaxID=3112166 RepID=UPI002DB77178|nr:response regulator transcription factor [Nocardia sp. CDC160]MEC3917499.1 response regulator transcription factor [Nocardia sp. CDC160]